MPNSILWIGLVVLWVFVLFPILADRHPRIRRTTEAALATRVLHRGDSTRRTRTGRARKKRSGRAPRKRRHGKDAEDRMATAEETLAESEPDDGSVAETGPDADSDALDTAEHDYDEDVDDDTVPTAETDPADGDSARTDDGTAPADKATTPAQVSTASAYEDTVPALTAASDEDTTSAGGGTVGAADTIAPARIPPARAAVPDLAHNTEGTDEDYVPTRRGRGGYDPEADALARAARYTFRQRAVLTLLLGAVLCGGLAVAIGPLFWWGCGGCVLALVAYLAYLRKQVRLEQEIRRRRSGRLAERDPEPVADRPPAADSDPAPDPRDGMDRDTARALRRRSRVLGPDDEDPVFEHLEAYDATVARTVRHRASGGDIRRAAGA